MDYALKKNSKDLLGGGATCRNRIRTVRVEGTAKVNVGAGKQGKQQFCSGYQQ